MFVCARARVSSDATCRQAQAGIFQCHPRQWEALYGDMSAPCFACADEAGGGASGQPCSGSRISLQMSQPAPTQTDCYLGNSG